MSDNVIPPVSDEAVEAAARAAYIWGADDHQPFDVRAAEWDSRLVAGLIMRHWEGVVSQALTAAYPLIEADLRARIAGEEAERIAAWITVEPQNDKRLTDAFVLLSDALRRGDHRATITAREATPTVVEGN